MSLDLQTLFDESGHDGPAHDVDCDYIVRRGRRARVRRQAVVGGTALLGAGVVAVAGGALLHDAGGATPFEAATTGQPAASASPSSTPAPTATPTQSAPSSSPVLTVTAGQKVDLGSGSYLTVTAAEKCFLLADPPNPSTPDCKSLTDGNQAPQSISLQSGRAGAGKPTVMTGIYTGSDATLITVASGGATKAATIVKLGARPSSLVYYLVWPADTTPGSPVVVEAFDSAGRSLARLGG